MSSYTRTCRLCLQSVDAGAPVLYKGSEPYHVRCRWPGYGQCVVCMGIIEEADELEWMFPFKESTQILRYHVECRGRCIN